MRTKVLGYLVLVAGLVQILLLIVTLITARRMNMLYAQIGAEPIHLPIYYAVLTAVACADILIGRKLMRRDTQTKLNAVAIAALVLSLVIAVKLLSLIMSALIAPIYNMG